MGEVVEAVEAACVADFLADTETVDSVCAMLGHRLASDTETPLGDPALGPLPPACLEKVARYLDRDSAIEFARVWDVCGDMPIRSMRVGGFPVCCRCARACVRTVSKAAANAMGRIVEEQHASGVVFDLEGQLLDDFLDDVDVDGTHAMQLTDFEGHGDGAVLLAELVAFADEDGGVVNVAPYVDLESSDGSEPSDIIDAWMDVTGLAHIDPQGFVDMHYGHLVQHERWGRELERVWAGQKEEMDRGRAAAPPPIARAAMIVSVGMALSACGGAKGPLDQLRAGACVACTLPGAFANVAGFVASLAVPFAARRALLDLLSDRSEFVALRRARRRGQKSPDRLWALECADVAGVCAVVGACQGCGLRTCDGTLNCSRSIGLTRRARLCMAPSIRRYEASVRCERQDRIVRKIPPISRITRRRKKNRDGRIKCDVCRNVLPKPTASPLVCSRCVRCCRDADCAIHFPPVEGMVRRRFAHQHPPPLLTF
jgi:hypothetical protein